MTNRNKTFHAFMWRKVKETETKGSSPKRSILVKGYYVCMYVRIENDWKKTINMSVLFLVWNTEDVIAIFVSYCNCHMAMILILILIQNSACWDHEACPKTFSFQSYYEFNIYTLGRALWFIQRILSLQVDPGL